MGVDIFRLDGYCALVTGASRGLGRAMAGALASAGADVIVTSRHGAEAQTAADEIAATGRRAIGVEADTADERALAALVQRSEEAFGKIDILVNNAGIGLVKPALEIRPSELDALLGVNLRGCFLCAQAVAPGMIARRFGRIINIGSILSAVATVGLAGYSASKHGVLGLTRALALEWAAHGITVNCLCPGFFKTALTQAVADDHAADTSVVARTPLGRWGQPEDLDTAILFLTSPASGFVTGSAVYVDGGWTAQ